eukprot:1317503-Rhodomonas_salina.1
MASGGAQHFGDMGSRPDDPSEELSFTVQTLLHDRDTVCSSPSPRLGGLGQYVQWYYCPKCHCAL